MARHTTNAKPPIVDTVIFDIGDVLVADGLYKIHRILGIPETPQLLSCWQAYKLGRCTEMEYWARTLKGSSSEGKEAELAKCVRDHYRLAMPTEAVPFVSRIKEAGYNVAILSNHSSEWARSVLSGMGLDKVCDPILISAEIHLAKPDPAIFAYTLGAVGRRDRPDLCAFFDDKIANIDVARSFGIRAFQYSGKKSLEQGLKEVGVMDTSSNLVYR